MVVLSLFRRLGANSYAVNHILHRAIYTNGIAIKKTLTFKNGNPIIPGMKTVSLKKFVGIHGQTGAAKQIGITQGAVRSAMPSDNVHIIVDEGNCFIDGYRVTPFPNPAAVARSKKREV